MPRIPPIPPRHYGAERNIFREVAELVGINIPRNPPPPHLPRFRGLANPEFGDVEIDEAPQVEPAPFFEPPQEHNPMLEEYEAIRDRVLNRKKTKGDENTMVNMTSIKFKGNVKFPFSLSFVSKRDEKAQRGQKLLREEFLSKLEVTETVITTDEVAANYGCRCALCGKYHIYYNMIDTPHYGRVCLLCMVDAIHVNNIINCKTCGTRLGLDILQIEFSGQPSAIPKNIKAIQEGHPFNMALYKTVYSDIRERRWYICENCGIKCGKCGRFVQKRDVLIEDIGCTNCVKLIKREPYNYIPPKIIFNKHSSSSPNDNTFIGIELEVHTVSIDERGMNSNLNPDILNHHIMTSVPNIKTMFYSMYDGSIEPGIEFASMPFDEACFLNKKNAPIRETLDIILSKLKSNISVNAHNKHPACGMHIHINRKCLTTKTIYNLLNFVYNNKAFMKTIAERDFENTPARNHITFSRFDYKNKVQKAIDKIGDDKYTIVNFMPRHTIEMRCFKSVLDMASISKNIEFVFALIAWCRDISHRESRDVANFVEFVKRRPKLYTNLIEFLSANKYV